MPSEKVFKDSGRKVAKGKTKVKTKAKDRRERPMKFRVWGTK